MAEALLLPALASQPIAVSAVAEHSEAMPIEWQRAEIEAEGDSLEEVFLRGEDYFLVPDQPKDGRALLPSASPIPKTRPYKRLSYLKRRIVALHLQGTSREKIAKGLGISPSTVSVVLRNPTTQAVISDELSFTDDELAALKPLVIERLRTTLRRPSDQRVGLQAVDLYMKSQHQYKDRPDRAHTAEDVIQEILKIRTEGPADITIARQEVKKG